MGSHIGMNTDIDALLADLELLVSSSQEDFKRRFWANYEKYLGQYNALLLAFHDKELCKDISPIDPVPEGKKAAYGIGFSPAEQAKLREITNAALSLLRKLTPQFHESRRDKLSLLRVEQLCSRFHIVARQLRSRYKGRVTIEVEDEYDVQDLMHALLMLDFEDIRVEEWTPSYAGGSVRMDFLLKRERIVIEIKKTRKGLAAREIGEQLIIDIEKYKEHPDCKILVCFVYDPEGRIANPRGVETDLEACNKDITLRVLIRPTGE